MKKVIALILLTTLGLFAGVLPSLALASSMRLSTVAAQARVLPLIDMGITPIVAEKFDNSGLISAASARLVFTKMIIAPLTVIAIILIVAIISIDKREKYEEQK